MQPNTPAWMTEDLALFQHTVRRFAREELVPNEERWAKQHHVDRETWLKAGSYGLLCPGIPEQYGGGGGSHAHNAIIGYELAYAIATSLGTNVHSAISAHYILRYASEEQKQRWLPKMATGELVCAIAMTEPGAGSDLQNIKTRAIRDGDHYVINGSKTFITNGFLADLVLLVCKTDPTRGAKGISIVVLEVKDLKGFRRGRILDKIGMQGQDTSELFFDDMRVPVENLLGTEEGMGFVQLMQQLPEERMFISMNALGAMERAVEETVKYARERKLFDKTLLDMQNTRFRLAEMQTTLAIARSFVNDCMGKMVSGELDPTTAAMAKWWLSQQTCAIVDEGLQLHGGYGYMLEYPIARLYANTRPMRIYGGSNEVMKELIARTL
ncbi:MAG: acyl-CoA dehydrogenase family protein [Parahaliea sp.]